MLFFLYITLISLYFFFSYIFYKRVFLKNILYIKRIFPEIKEKKFTLKLFPKVGLLLTLLLPSKMILNVGWKDKNTVAWYIYLIILSFLFWFFLFSCNVYLIMIAYFYMTLHIEIFIFSYLYHRSSFFNAKMILFLGAEISLDKIVRFYLGNPWDAAKQSAIFAAGSFTVMFELIREHMVADQMADAHMQSYKQIADNDLLEAKSIIKTNLDKRMVFLEAKYQIDSSGLDKTYAIAEKAVEENMEVKTLQALAEINRQKRELSFALVDKSLEASKEAAKAVLEASEEAAKTAIEERFSYRDQALRSQPLYHALSSTKVTSSVNFEYKSPKP